SLSLAPTELREGVSNAPSEQRIARFLPRGVWELTLPESTPGLAHRPPTAIVVRLVYDNAVEPCGQTRFLPEPIQRPIGLNKSVLDDVLCRRVIAAYESPRQAPRPLTV